MGTKWKDRTWSGRGFGGGRQLYTRSPEIAQPSVIGATCEFQGNTASPADRARVGEDVLATLQLTACDLDFLMSIQTSSPIFLDSLISVSYWELRVFRLLRTSLGRRVDAPCVRFRFFRTDFPEFQLCAIIFVVLVFSIYNPPPLTPPLKGVS